VAATDGDLRDALPEPAVLIVDVVSLPDIFEELMGLEETSLIEQGDSSTASLPGGAYDLFRFFRVSQLIPASTGKQATVTITRANVFHAESVIKRCGGRNGVDKWRDAVTRRVYTPCNPIEERKVVVSCSRPSRFLWTAVGVVVLAGFGCSGTGAHVERVERPEQAASKPTGQDWYRQAMALIKEDRRGDAVAAFDRSVALDSGNPLAWANRGTNLLNLGRYEDAIKSYKRALAIHADDPYVYCSLATAYNRAGKPENALSSAKTAIEIDPEFVWARFNMAQALRALGRDDEAEAVLEQAFELRPDLRDPQSEKP